MPVVVGCCLHGAHVYSEATNGSMALPQASFLWVLLSFLFSLICFLSVFFFGNICPSLFYPRLVFFSLAHNFGSSWHFLWHKRKLSDKKISLKGNICGDFLVLCLKPTRRRHACQFLCQCDDLPVTSSSDRKFSFSGMKLFFKEFYEIPQNTFAIYI